MTESWAGNQFGLGDTAQSLFLSPKALAGLGGQALLMPTATDEQLGGEKWGGGPTAVVLKQTANGWTYSGLTNRTIS